jgi:hypothetical protein
MRNLGVFAQTIIAATLTTDATRVSLSLEIPAGSTGYRLQIAAGTATAVFVSKPQVELGSTATEYQPITTNTQFAADNWANNLQAIQPTTSNKPMLRQTPTSKRYWLEALDAARSLNVTFATAPGTMYVGRVTPEGIEWATENWSATTKSLVGTGTYNAGIIARNREFTANEKALVERYFGRQLPLTGEWP